MPKALRSTSQGQYRANPVPIASSSQRQQQQIQGQQYANIVPATMQSLVMPSMSSSMGLGGYSHGGPVHQQHHLSRTVSHNMYQPQDSQQNHSQSLHQSAPAVQPLQPMPVRASSGAWTPQDDQVLMQARSQGMNWAPIQAQFFQNKTPNACRKRHERLMDRRNSDEWDTVKNEQMAKEYMAIRAEMWKMLADRLPGEKWAVLETKCMASGLKNLASQARACTRRERLGGDPFATVSLSPNGGGGHSHNASQGSNGSYEDSGIGIEDFGTEAEDEYSSGLYHGTHHNQHHTHAHQHSHNNGINGSGASSISQQQQQQHGAHAGHQQQQQQYQSGRSYQHGPQSLTPETDGGRGGYERGYGSQDMGHGMHSRNHSMSMQGGYGMSGGRGSSAGSMGIGSIINQGV